MPLELFVVIGTFIEELLSPIPSFIVMIPAGAAAQVQGAPWWYLFVLATISGLSRVIAALVLYWLADKFEDVIFAKGRRVLGVSHQQVEKFGQRLAKEKGATHVWIVLFLMHALPIFPGAVLSLACGFIKIKLSTFVTTVLFGSIVCALFYLYLGYAGLQTAMLLDNLEVATQITLLVVLLCITGAVLYMYWRRRRLH